jgi:hypothetical protein
VGGFSQIVQAKSGFNLAANNAQSRAGQINATESYRLGDSRGERIVNTGGIDDAGAFDHFPQQGRRPFR